MKVVIKATHITHGGGLTHLNKMIEWFGNLAPKDEFVLIGKEGQQRIFVAAPENFEYRFYRVPSLNLGARLIWEKAVFPRVLKFLKPDLLFEPGNTGTLNAPCPRVSLVHNIAPFDMEYIKEESTYQRLRQSFLRRATVKNISSAEGVIMLSEYCDDYFCNYIKPARIKTEVIYHGGAEDNIGSREQKVESDLELPEEYILSVSHVWRYKKLEELVKGYLMACALDSKVPDLVHAGSVYDKAYMNGIMELVRNSSFPNKIKFLGNVDSHRLQKLYHNCNSFVFSSVLETCSVILIEALSHGCAMACSRSSVVPEICRDAAIYFDPLSPEDIAQKIHAVCQDKSLNASLRTKAKNRSKDFSWKESAAKTLSFFERIKSDNYAVLDE